MSSAALFFFEYSVVCKPSQVMDSLYILAGKLSLVQICVHSMYLCWPRSARLSLQVTPAHAIALAGPMSSTYSPSAESILLIAVCGVLKHTAGIISLLTHVCVSVALNIVVRPKLTYEHESACHQGLHTQLCNPSCSDSCKP